MAGTSVAPKTVVVADDTAFVRDRFRTTLEQAGHRAITVGSASELLRLIKADVGGIDLVLLDLRLPDSPGVDVVRAIRRFDGGRLAVLIFSGTIASAEEVRALAALGVAGYVNEYSSPPHIMPALTPHLFPDSFNRRSSPRVAIGVAIQYRVASRVVGALMLNLSRGGLAIRTTSPLSVGEQLLVKFRLPGSGREVDAPGRVVWSDSRVGMGVQFEAVDSAAQTLIDHFVDTHFFSNRKA